MRPGGSFWNKRKQGLIYSRCACDDVRLTRPRRPSTFPGSSIMSRTSTALASCVSLAAAILVIATSCSTAPRGVVTDPAARTQAVPRQEFDDKIDANAQRLMKEGKQIFRYDSFGSEAFWGE